MINPKKVLVIGATGHVGGQVVSQLAAAGTEVRALSRKPPASAPGVEAFRGDLSAPETLEPALRGVDAVFVTWPFLGPDAARAIVATIAEHARHVVLLSSGAVRDDLDEQPHPIGAAHADIERPIRESGMDWTFLRPYAFATNTLEWAPDIRAGDVVRGAYGAAAMTMIHEADIAAVAVRALTTDGHAGARYELTGSEPLTRVQQVEAIGRALGRELRWEEISREAAKERMTWTAPDIAEIVLDSFASVVGSRAPGTSTVEDVLGVPPRSYQQWAVDHVADFS
ncbi:NAD(P)H-binding protein [Saccharopolyspora taberi]